MFNATMFRVPGTKIYVFMGIFNNLPNCENTPVIKHFGKFLKKNDIKNFEVIYHTTATTINSKIFKIGIYLKKDNSSGENGADNSSNSRTIDMTKVIDMRKRA
jgi:hypothetical protein